MALVKLALTFAIVAWYRGDWVRAQLRRHARVFGDALARLGVGARGIDPARAPLEWTVEDGTDTSAHGRLARERRAILERAKRRAGAREDLGAGAAGRMAEKLEVRCRRRDKRRFAGGAGDGASERWTPRRARRGAEGALDGGGRAPRPGPRARAAETREVGDAASATSR